MTPSVTSEKTIEQFYIRIAGKLVSDYKMPKESVYVCRTVLNGQRLLNLRLRATNIPEFTALVENARDVLCALGVPPNDQRMIARSHMSGGGAAMVKAYTAHVFIRFDTYTLPPSQPE